MEYETVFGYASVPSIIVICYLAAQLLKVTPLNNKYLPCICGVLGAVLGVAALYVVPGYPANDLFSAIAVGIVSGLSATGVNQIYKQLSSENKGE